MSRKGDPKKKQIDSLFELTERYSIKLILLVWKFQNECEIFC